MSFKLLLYAPDGHPEHNLQTWPEALKNLIPDIEVTVADSEGEAIESIRDVDAAFGNIGLTIFRHANNLKWLACPQAGPSAGWYHSDLISSNVVVTNTRDIYNDHISTHILSFILAFARGLNLYFPHQIKGEWRRPNYPIVHLPDSTVLIIGIGGIGAETARLCKSFGMTVIASDPRVEDSLDFVDELVHPDEVDFLIPRANFVVSTVPETPRTQNYFDKTFFSKMKNEAYFINIGRGATVVLDDLNEGLREGDLRGAALDVFQIEPLPEDHPLWTAPGILITPHVAGEGPYLPERRTELFLENCKRFSDGKQLMNIVDKSNWF